MFVCFRRAEASRPGFFLFEVWGPGLDLFFYFIYFFFWGGGWRAKEEPKTASLTIKASCCRCPEPSAGGHPLSPLNSHPACLGRTQPLLGCLDPELYPAARHTFTGWTMGGAIGEWSNTAPRAWLCLQVQGLAHGQLSLGHPATGVLRYSI